MYILIYAESLTLRPVYLGKKSRAGKRVTLLAKSAYARFARTKSRQQLALAHVNVLVVLPRRSRYVTLP